MARQDYYVDSETYTAHVTLALEFALKSLPEWEGSTLCVIAPTKENLRGSDLRGALGEQDAAHLYKTGHVTINGKSVRFHSERSLPNSAPNTVVLLVHPTASLMTKVDALPGINRLIVVPWIREFVQPWIEAHGPTDFLSGQQTPAISPSDPDVINALISLLRSINHSTGVHNPIDKKRAVDTFAALAEQRIPAEPREVRAWLIQHGLSPLHAEDIAAIAKKQGDGMIC